MGWASVPEHGKKNLKVSEEYVVSLNGGIFHGEKEKNSKTLKTLQFKDLHSSSVKFGCSKV